MTAEQVNAEIKLAATRLDDANDALILNIDVDKRKAEIIDEVAYERDGVIKLWGHLHWTIKGHTLYLKADSVAGGGLYKRTIAISQRSLYDDLWIVLSELLSSIQQDYIDEGP